MVEEILIALIALAGAIIGGLLGSIVAPWFQNKFNKNLLLNKNVLIKKLELYDNITENLMGFLVELRVANLQKQRGNKITTTELEERVGKLIKLVSRSFLYSSNKSILVMIHLTDKNTDLLNFIVNNPTYDAKQMDKLFKESSECIFNLIKVLRNELNMDKVDFNEKPFKNDLLQ